MCVHIELMAIYISLVNVNMMNLWKKEVMNEMNELFRRHRKSVSWFGRSRCCVDSSISWRPRNNRAERLQRAPEIDGRGEAN